MAIGDDFPLIEVPDWASIINHRYVVYVEYEDGRRIQRSLGKLVSELSEDGKQQFQPNQYCMNRFPYLCGEIDCYSPGASCYSISGVYAAFLKLSSACGLYQTVQYAFGANYGNALMDYALFSIDYCESSLDDFDYYLSSHMHFSVTRNTTSRVTKILKSSITDLMIANFKKAWIEEYLKNTDTSEVWLCVDGKAQNTKNVGSALAVDENSGCLADNEGLIGQIWAIDRNNGMPVTWWTVDKDSSDQDAIQDMLLYLQDAGIKVKGVLFDSSLASEQIMNTIEQSELEYCIRLSESCMGFVQLYEPHAQKIRCNVRHLVSSNGFYGCVDKAQVFKNSSVPMNVGLFYNDVTALKEIVLLNREVTESEHKANLAIKQNQSFEIAPQYKDIISVIKDSSGQVEKVEIDQDRWQQQANTKGYFALASSLDLSAEKLISLYSSREPADLGFKLLRGMSSSSTKRGRNTRCSLSQTVVAFIIVALRTLFAQACERVDMIEDESTDDMHSFNDAYSYMPNSKASSLLDRLRSVAVSVDINNRFQSDFGGERFVIELFRVLGITITDLRDLAEQMNLLKDKANLSEFRTLPSFDADGILTQSERHHRRMKGQEIPISCIVPKDFDDIPIKRRPGRPKSRKTLEQEAADALLPPKPPAKIGRPKGSKNKKTLEREAAEALLPPKPPAKIGRPKGSKNKKTLEREAAEALLPPKPPAKIGRPKGSKNKKTLAREAAEALQ